MAIHLSKDRYESTPHGTVISWGIIENSPDGVNIDRDWPPKLLWSAWKGHGNDWAIYVTSGVIFQNILEATWEEALQYCHDHGQKVFDEENIEKMIDADPEVKARYRR